jgi:GAF domain-containing protein
LPASHHGGGADDEVLGTFGSYYRDLREPTPHEVETVRTLASIAARALQRVG